MKIAIDIQTTMGQPTGFGFYVSNLVKSLKKVADQDELILIAPKSEKDFSTPKRFLWDQFVYPKKVKQAKADLLHQPCFSAPLLYRGPVVITIHDIISILFPQNIPFASRMFYSRWMPLTYGKAKKIITISESTKRDIVRVLNIPPEKIKVIPLAVDEKFQNPVSKSEVERVRAKYKLPQNYILHIGTLEPRKNLGFLIEIFPEIIKEVDDISLVICGKKGWYYEGLFEEVKRLKLEKKVIFTGYIDEEDKPALYKGAKIFAFPSLYEGFGLPPLEAMAAGVPVISSNTSSMPEVLGEAGILIAPDDKPEWIKSVIEVAKNPELRAQMIAKNKEQIKKFSWEKTALETIKVYHEVMADE